MNRLKKGWPPNKEATEINLMNFESETMPWLFIRFKNRPT